jgi:hypothetical protein
VRCLWLLALLATAPALADLYRWVDPRTGSVKYSSYPPPWYGDPAQERRAPKVEHIPAAREAPPIKPMPGLEDKPAAPATAAAPNAQAPAQDAAPKSNAPTPAQFEAQRKAVSEAIERMLKDPRQ